jgi:hypothetical protein
MPRAGRLVLVAPGGPEGGQDGVGLGLFQAGERAAGSAGAVLGWEVLDADAPEAGAAVGEEPADQGVERAEIPRPFQPAQGLYHLARPFD